MPSTSNSAPISSGATSWTLRAKKARRRRGVLAMGDLEPVRAWLDRLMVQRTKAARGVVSHQQHVNNIHATLCPRLRTAAIPPYNKTTSDILPDWKWISPAGRVMQIRNAAGSKRWNRLRKSRATIRSDVHGCQDGPEIEAAKPARDRGARARAASLLLLRHGADDGADPPAVRGRGDLLE